MIGLRIGAAELAEIEAGTPAVVLAPGAALPSGSGLLPLVLQDGVLARPGQAAGRSVPAPRDLHLLALLAPDPAAGLRLAPMLPAGLAEVRTPSALIGLLASALKAASAERLAAEADRDRLRRALGTLPPPRPRRVLDLPPCEGPGVGLPLSQPLGRPAEGLCTVELHLAAPGTAALHAKLLAGGRILGAWRIPPGALAPGWLALDLPEPAPSGPEEAVIELSADPGAGVPPLLSPGGSEGGACVALRAWTAPRGWSVLPRHIDWAAAGLPPLPPGVPLPLPAALLAGTTAEGARVELVAAGEEVPRLVAELRPGAEALLRLPPVVPGPADLLRLRLSQPGRAAGRVEAAVTLGGGGEAVGSGWREIPAAGGLALALPLPAAPMLTVSIALRHAGEGPATVELSGIALMAGAAGEPRRPPPDPPASPAAQPAQRRAVVMPGGPAGQADTLRAGPPAPRMEVAGPGGLSVAAVPLPSAVASLGMAGGTSYQDLRLIQHMVNAEGTYRHIDVTVRGLVSSGGLWRHLRFKLFERRGITGLEFREMKGWPQIFDAWPGGAADGFGPYWRLETVGTAKALAALATPHDRALVAALLEVLPELAARAAAEAGLPEAGTDAWAKRGRAVAEVVADVRGAGRTPG
jgi:hypothetical protein